MDNNHVDVDVKVQVNAKE